jgi:hypothetical protein
VLIGPIGRFGGYPKADDISDGLHGCRSVRYLVTAVTAITDKPVYPSRVALCTGMGGVY